MTRPLHVIDSLSSLPLDLQEASIIEDLLYVFMGHEGNYIHYAGTYDPKSEQDTLKGPQWVIADGLDPSLRDLCMGLCRMSTWYVSVSAFVEIHSRAEFGVVNHALCAAIRKLLKEYLVLVAQLEHQFLTNPAFTLHTLHLHALPTSHTLFHMYSLAHEVMKRNATIEEEKDMMDDMDNIEGILEALKEGNDITSGVLGKPTICKGGAVLGLLSTRLSSLAGDPAARKLLSHLLKEASKPYMKMLNEWLHHGEIRDPHQEFLVKEQKSIKRERLDEDYTDEYWEKRYTLREGEVPPQLESVKEKVLLAGKYLNVVRECGGVDVSKTDERDKWPMSFEHTNFLDNVNSAYAHANSSLLELLLTTHELPARLRSLKHYFFLDQSDFFTHFLALASHELKKPAKNANLVKLQSLLDITLHSPGTIAASDPFKEDVKVQMNKVWLTDWLMRVLSVKGLGEDGLPTSSFGQSTSDKKDQKELAGFDALQLDYTVPFPLSLVISRQAVTKYQLLFRHLLSLKNVEQLLGDTWMAHMKDAQWSRFSKHRRLEIWKKRAWALRSRMMSFIQQLAYFCTSEVIEPNWQGMRVKLEKVTTVDELMKDHVDFLDTCLKECMLTNHRLLKIQGKLIYGCTMFGQMTTYLARSLATADPMLDPTQFIPKDGPFPEPNAAKMNSLEELLQKHEEHFARNTKIMMDAVSYYAGTESARLLSLVVRLDWEQARY
ncbi:hypothetical protein SAICODRAFT_59768 [Saitoella complicata NRRL Y-17804]|uniref:uncharacterized protein n=1 Tax=Saitoella complicata (strain BCRC 22490 / CBS 7301 / JCM 7358 / NBRC 10748 / NRRL Y-17804) TaxID=698492 RepID=UPI0008668777|nr:uncharacterized protein SAICODRAFT_59768 [Saitoella complicata NRRL Y-17804]ODQ51604.1 hypothetical protein SAICODRAFT_59768 [Saitoella complicata NRRL Y-17804]